MPVKDPVKMLKVKITHPGGNLLNGVHCIFQKLPRGVHAVFLKHLYDGAARFIAEQAAEITGAQIASVSQPAARCV